MILKVRNWKNYPALRNFLLLAILTALAMLVQGYHPGIEDDGVYLPAIKKHLNPALYPHDADFFQLQLQATIFDNLVADSVKLSHLPLAWVLLLWQFASILLMLWAAREISRRCFPEPHAQWSAVAMVGALLTLPVPATALYVVDQHLHPRALATALILAAVAATLDRRRVWAGILLVSAALIHPLMASFGISFCIFLWVRAEPGASLAAALLLPMGWVFEPTSKAWQQAANTRDYYFLSRVHWYEWLGVLAPFLFLAWFRYLARRDRLSTLAHVASRLVLFGVFQFVVAVAIMLPVSLQRLRPFQPMRYLHLFYLIFLLLAGGLIGQKILRTKVWRWMLLFVPMGLGMFYAQRQTFPATEHLEWPGTHSRNSWIQAFAWVRENSPPDSLFALDPRYLEMPGEDFHCFRALAERSALADYVKDASVATQVPRLAPRWQAEVEAQMGWKTFQQADFHRLKERFAANWVVLANPGVRGLVCPYRNRDVLVCRLD